MSQLDWEQSMEIKVKIQDDTNTYLNKAIEVFHNSLRGIYYYRTLKKILHERDIGSSAAFIYVKNSLFMMAVIEWAKLFCSKKDDTHFSKIITQKYIYDDFQEFFKKRNINNYDDLRSLLLTAIKMTPSEFDKYTDDMLKFRDKFIAHSDLDLHRKPKNKEEQKKQDDERLQHYPTLVTAMESLFWLYELIIELLEGKIESLGNYRFRVHSRSRIEELTNKECEEFQNALIIPSE